jgi:ornithine cyclodeaminase/alanine dehydrogenase-like protein (mu-crystallin family)
MSEPSDPSTEERNTLLVSRNDVEALLSVRDAIDVVSTVFAAHGWGKAIAPSKASLDLRPLGIPGWHHAMPGYIQPSGAAGLKWVGAYAHNPARGLPLITAMIVLQDPDSGYPLAILDGGTITALRTGAVVAVCAQQFAGTKSATWALVGAGQQAHAALRAIFQLMPVGRVRIFSRTTTSSARLAKVAAQQVNDVRVSATLREAVQGADVIVTATSADSPLLEREWIAPGATVISIGSYQELADEAVVGFDKIFVDSWHHCSERGELARLVQAGRLTFTDISAEIGEVIVGSKPGRQSDSETILVVPIGLPTHDLALAQLVCQRLPQSAGRFRFF